MEVRLRSPEWPGLFVPVAQGSGCQRRVIASHARGLLPLTPTSQGTGPWGHRGAMETGQPHGHRGERASPGGPLPTSCPWFLHCIEPRFPWKWGPENLGAVLPTAWARACHSLATSALPTGPPAHLSRARGRPGGTRVTQKPRPGLSEQRGHRRVGRTTAGPTGSFHKGPGIGQSIQLVLVRQEAAAWGRSLGTGSPGPPVPTDFSVIPGLPKTARSSQPCMWLSAYWVTPSRCLTWKHPGV